MKTERRTISIPRGAKIGTAQEPIYGHVDVPADCLDGLCVHKALKGARWRWMVAHEASGMCIERIGAMKKSEAIENMRAALALDFDWTRDETETLAALRERRDVVDAINEIAWRD